MLQSQGGAQFSLLRDLEQGFHQWTLIHQAVQSCATVALCGSNRNSSALAWILQLVLFSGVWKQDQLQVLK